MIKRLNFTGRKRIPRENIKIALLKANIIEIRIDTEHMALEKDSEVYAEVYRRMVESEIYFLGNLKDGVLARNIIVKESLISGLKLRIFVVDPATGKIIAHADKLKIEHPQSEEGFLECIYGDIGNEVWRVQYEGEEGAPVLVWNRKIPGIQNLSQSDPMFFMFVAPAVLREVLTHIIFVDKLDSVDEPQIEWHGKWIRFAWLITEEKPSAAIESGDNFDEEEALRWIDGVVEYFCSTQTNYWDSFLRKFETGGS